MADDLIVTVQETNNTFVSVDASNPVYLESLDYVGDVDMTTNGKVNGSILVYNSATSKWTSTTLLEAQTVEAGEF